MQYLPNDVFAVTEINRSRHIALVYDVIAEEMREGERNRPRRDSSKCVFRGRIAFDFLLIKGGQLQCVGHTLRERDRNHTARTMEVLL